MLSKFNGLIAQVSLNPDDSSRGLPGLTTAQRLINDLGKYALFAALVGLLVSAAIWAVGAHSQNFSQTYNGKKGVAVSVGAALIIGAAAFLVNEFYSVGSQVTN